LAEKASKQTAIEFGGRGLDMMNPERISAAEQHLAEHGANRSQRPYDSSIVGFITPKESLWLRKRYSELFLTFENVKTVVEENPDFEEHVTDLFSRKKFTIFSLCASSGIPCSECVKTIFLDVGNSKYARSNGVGQKILNFANGTDLCTFHEFLTATNPQGELFVSFLQKTPFPPCIDLKKSRYCLEKVDGELKDFELVYADARALLAITEMVDEHLFIPEDEAQHQKSQELRRLQEVEEARQQWEDEQPGQWFPEELAQIVEADGREEEENRRRDEVRQRMAELSRQHAELERQIDELLSQHDELGRQVYELLRQSAEILGRLTELCNRRMEIRDKGSELQERISELNERQTELWSQISKKILLIGHGLEYREIEELHRQIDERSLNQKSWKKSKSVK